MKSKSRRGFTLIELIAVIVIIGVIAILIVPTVSGYIVNTRNSAYKSHEKAMSEAAESYTIECISNNGAGCELPGPNEEKEIYLNELIDEDFIDKLGDPAKNGKYCNPNTSYIKIYNTGNNNYKYVSCLYCSNYSTESEQCVIYGTDGDVPECVTLETHSEWTNESRQVRVGCSDRTSGCLKSEFKRTFTSTTDKGVITITDKSGNSTDCEVDVKVDKTPPTCEIKANGTPKNGWYPLGTTFTLTSYNDNESGVLTYGTGTSVHSNFNKVLVQTPPRGVTRVFGYVQDAAGNIGTCSINAKIKTEFIIHYNANNGTGTMPDKKCMVDEDCILDQNTFTRTGYKFNGWNTRSDGTGKPYVDKGNAKNIVFSGETTLYAQWKTIDYNIKYNLGGGAVTPANPEKYTIETNTFTLNNPTKTGYTFGGWTGTGLTSATSTVTIEKGSYGDREYTANWTANPYTISYTTNGGVLGTNKPTSGTYDSLVTISNPTKTFTVNINANNQGASIKNSAGTAVTSASSTQTFSGWTSTSLGSNAKTGSNNNPVTSWTGASTKNSYFKNLRESGTVTMIANWTAVNVTLPNISKTGHTCGYATSASGNKLYNSGAAYTPSTTTNTDTLYAKCTPNNYTVTFNVNGGNNWTSTTCGSGYTLSGTTCTKSVTYNGTYGSMPTPTRDHYTFAGWYTDASNGTKIDTSTTVAITSNQTLYAHWNAAPKAVITCDNKTYNGSAQTIASCPNGTLSGARQTNVGTYTVSCTGNATHSNADNVNCSISCPSGQTPNGSGGCTDPASKTNVTLKSLSSTASEPVTISNLDPTKQPSCRVITGSATGTPSCTPSGTTITVSITGIQNPTSPIASSTGCKNYYNKYHNGTDLTAVNFQNAAGVAEDKQFVYNSPYCYVVSGTGPDYDSAQNWSVGSMPNNVESNGGYQRCSKCKNNNGCSNYQTTGSQKNHCPGNDARNYKPCNSDENGPYCRSNTLNCFTGGSKKNSGKKTPICWGRWTMASEYQVTVEVTYYTK